MIFFKKNLSGNLLSILSEQIKKEQEVAQKAQTIAPKPVPEAEVSVKSPTVVVPTLSPKTIPEVEISKESIPETEISKESIPETQLSEMTINELEDERAKLNKHQTINIDKIEFLKKKYKQSTDPDVKEETRKMANKLRRDNDNLIVREIAVTTELYKRFIQFEEYVSTEKIEELIKEENEAGTIRSCVNLLKKIIPVIQQKSKDTQTSTDKSNLILYNKLKPYIPEFEKQYDIILSIEEKRKEQELEINKKKYFGVKTVCR